MPRAGKTSKAPGPHDKRESGLVAPGKKVTRQRSNGQLNGQPNGRPASAVSPPPLPSTGLNSGYKFPRPADTAADTPPTAASAAAKDHAALLEAVERDRASSDASADDVGPCGEMADTAREHQHYPASPVADDPPAPACKSTPYAAGSLSAFSTILTYYPLRDAISILILLLSLPPTLVLVIQTLFASLTFVPPTAGLSLSALPNAKEMFSSTNFGYPALATILIVDLIIWAIWLGVWRPVQSIFLDLSQAVIAVSLSGAAASASGPTYSIATCTLIVCAVHVLRYKAIHLTALDYLRSVLHKMEYGIPFDAPPFAQSSYSSTPFERGVAFTIIRTILGIHIVSQGVTTCIRRGIAISKANERDTNVPSITKTDTEATAGVDAVTRSSTGVPAGTPPAHSSSSTDSRPPGQPPALRDNKHRESSSKKKRKQANQVRSQQPLWAAIASTKVTFVKEMEQRDATNDAREANIMDDNTINPFESAPSATADRLWICEVRDTEISFGVELAAESSTDSSAGKEEELPIHSAIDRSKPFYVRVNGAAWSSARIISSAATAKSAGDRYEGVIFGLAPLSSYHCEIVSLSRQRVLCAASLITQPAPTAEQTVAAPAPPQHQALRPSSPITTLKQSIQSAEAKLNDVRNRTRKTKKDQRAVHADIKKEINSLRTKLESSGGVDDKQERRLQQITQHKNQAEEATAELKAQIEAMGEIPSDELAEASARKRSWQSALDTKKTAERDLDESKAQARHEVDVLKSDIAASEQKKEKLAARIAQRAQELEKLTAKQRAEMTAKQKREFERAQTVQARETKQNELLAHIASMESEAQLFHQKAQETYQQSAALSGYSTQPPAAYPNYSSPPTPEGALPGSNGQVSPQANGFPSIPFGPQPFGSPFAAAPLPVASKHALVAPPRGRSSSMLSQYSGFTDNGEDYTFSGEPRPAQQHQNSWPLQHNAAPGTVREERKISDAGDNASGSGSGSLVNGSTNGSNSPRPDAKPFVPGAAAAAASKVVGTIGPPSRKSPSTAHAGAVGGGGGGGR